MDPALFETLRSLPGLGADRARVQTRACKLCRAPAPPFDAVDLNKICSMHEPYAFGLSGVLVPYFRCETCGFLFTPFFDDWSAAEFARFIYNEDYIKVDGDYAEIRPAAMAAFVAAKAAHAREARILDYGSGAGGLARKLRDRGFRRVENYDPISSPERPAGPFDIVTCFEVLEHSTAPLAMLEDIRSFLAFDGCVLFTTGIQPDDIAERRAGWWYVGPRNGHASIFTIDALGLLAARCGLVLHAGAEGMAFSTGQFSAASAALLGSAGHPSLFVALTAPSDPAERGMAAGYEADWYGVEGSGADRFRWTRASEVRWRIELPRVRPCTLKLHLRFQMEIEPGFAAASRVRGYARTAAAGCGERLDGRDRIGRSGHGGRSEPAHAGAAQAPRTGWQARPAEPRPRGSDRPVMRDPVGLFLARLSA